MCTINLKWYKANMEKLSINTERLTIRNLEIKDLSDCIRLVFNVFIFTGTTGAKTTFETR